MTRTRRGLEVSSFETLDTMEPMKASITGMYWRRIASEILDQANSVVSASTFDGLDVETGLCDEHITVCIAAKKSSLWTTAHCGE